MNRKNIMFATILVVAYLLWNPVTRSVVLLVLPLGSGYDDIAFIVAAFILGTWYAVSTRKERAMSRTTLIFIGIIVITLILIAIAYLTAPV